MFGHDLLVFERGMENGPLVHEQFTDAFHLPTRDPLPRSKRMRIPQVSRQ
jgi:hypothetical protein